MQSSPINNFISKALWPSGYFDKVTISFRFYLRLPKKNYYDKHFKRGSSKFTMTNSSRPKHVILEDATTQWVNLLKSI